MSPKKHFVMGEALTVLKKEGYLIIGSGSSVHGGFGQKESAGKSVAFDKGLTELCLTKMDRNERIAAI